MSQATDSQPAPVQVLLLATEQQVYAFELSQRFRVSIGRHEANDVRLSSRTVSNYHAEIVGEEDGLVLRDLGSTNGTYANARKVTEKRLKSGDRLRIGNHVLTVSVKPLSNRNEGYFRYRRDPESFGVGTRGNIISIRGGSEHSVKTLQTEDPHDLSLADLLKILTANAHSVMVLVKKDSDKGRVFIHKDRIVHAEYNRAWGEKALYRLFAWQKAGYEVKEYPGNNVPRTIALPTDTLLMEGMQQVGELAKLVAQLPPLEVPLRLKEDCPLPVSAHTSAEIEIYQDIIRYETIARVLEESPMTDVRLLRLIDALLRKQVFEVADSSPGLLEETFIRAPVRELDSA